MSGERCIRAEKEKEDGIKLAKSTISMDVGSDNTVFLFASLGLRQLTTDPGKKKKKKSSKREREKKAWRVGSRKSTRLGNKIQGFKAQLCTSWENLS